MSMHTHETGQEPASGAGHHGHWMMMVCCIPMIVIGVVLVATGIASPGFLFVAFACTAMMFVMMRAMGGSDEDQT